MPNISIIKGDCVETLKAIESNSVDLIITSPPYNLNIKYNQYKDNKKRGEYLEWTNDYTIELYRILKDKGSYFLNLGTSNKDPWISMDVANIVRKIFILQNNIIWVKSISIDEKSYGHFKPINSPRFTNHLFENIFHFTKTGDIKINRKAIGVPFADKSNLKRTWNKNKENNRSREDLRCRGNVWFIPYDTIQNKDQKGKHPAIFPEKLVDYCIRLHGFDKNTLIVDPFLGTGTTLVVAKKLNINGIGIDIDQDYIEYAKGRIKSATIT